MREGLAPGFDRFQGVRCNPIDIDGELDRNVVDGEECEDLVADLADVPYCTGWVDCLGAVELRDLWLGGRHETFPWGEAASFLGSRTTVRSVRPTIGFPTGTFPLLPLGVDLLLCHLRVHNQPRVAHRRRVVMQNQTTVPTVIGPAVGIREPVLFRQEHIDEMADRGANHLVITDARHVQVLSEVPAERVDLDMWLLVPKMQPVDLLPQERRGVDTQNELAGISLLRDPPRESSVAVHDDRFEFEVAGAGLLVRVDDPPVGLPDCVCDSLRGLSESVLDNGDVVLVEVESLRGVLDRPPCQLAADD